MLKRSHNIFSATLGGALLITLISACSSVKPQTPQPTLAPPNKVTTPKLTLSLANRYETTLANGLRVIVQQDHRAPIVMSQVWYNIGATDEPDGSQNNKALGGISHLLEHMMFKGTPTVSGEDFSRIVSRFGGSQNAFTSYDYTAYYELFPAKRLPLALELEADRMQNLQLNTDDFTKERQVVMEERRQRTDDNPNATAYEQFRYMALPNSPQGKPVIGAMKIIENITLDNLKQWYTQWYAPNNATLVVVGDVQADAVFKQAQRYFGDIPKRPLPARPSVSQPSFIGYREKILNLPVNVPTLFMAFNVPSLVTADNKDTAYGLSLLSDVLDGGLSARFESRLVRGQELLASVGTSYDMFDRGDGLFFIQATPREGVSLDTAKNAILAEINALKDHPIQTDEITRAKTNALTGLIYHQDSIAGQAQLIGKLASIGLDDRLIANLPQKISQIDSQSLHQLAKTYFTPNNLSVMKVLPETQGSIEDNTRQP